MDGIGGFGPFCGGGVWPRGFIRSENGFLSEDGLVPRERLLSGVRVFGRKSGRSEPTLRGSSGRLRSVSSGFGSFRSTPESDGSRSDLTSLVVSMLFNRFGDAERSMSMGCRSSVRRSMLNCLRSESRFRRSCLKLGETEAMRGAPSRLESSWRGYAKSESDALL